MTAQEPHPLRYWITEGDARHIESKFNGGSKIPSLRNHPCSNHSSGTDAIRKEAITELERIKAIVDDIPPHLKNENYCRGRAFGIDIAIKLLKEGIRK